MHSSKLKKISVALCMALLPISVIAAGLGKLNVQSGIGEPLRADIELISITPDELSSITAAIASEEAYTAQGIERPASHNSIKVAVAKNSSGAPILKLNSDQPISEPFLDMLLQVDWNSGRLLREYTVLLDPPGYTGEADSSAQPISTAQAPVVKSTKAVTVDSTAAPDAPVGAVKKTRKHRAKAAPATETEASSSSADTTGQEYVTQKGDTLAKIARDMKPEGVSLDQMLVGLYQANQDAFSGANMNRLNVGKIIRQPTADELNAITSKDAKKEIKVQTADWNAYRNKLGGMVADSKPVADSEASSQSSGGKIKTAAEDKSMPANVGPKDVVKLSAGDNKIDANETKALQTKITALQEEAVAREKSLKEAQDRTAALEKQIADMQKLIAMKSNAMSDAQKQAEAEAAKPSPPPVEVAKPAETKSAEVKPVEAKPAETTVAPSEPAKPEVKPVAPVPVEEPGFMSGLLDGTDPMILGGAGGLLALLGGGWLFLRNKRKKNLADFEQGIMTSGGLKANTVFGNTSSSNVDTGDTSFLTDFSQSASGGMIDTNDVDPIAEAEVYMAYGRDAQAEEILKDAITKEPKRYELHLKLLEMYAASKNMSAFETVSGELYTTLGADDPTWAKVAEIGSKLEPGNPLYQVKSSLTGVVAANMGDEKSKLDASDFADSPLAGEKDLDMSFGGDTVPNSLTSEMSEMGEVQMDSGMGESGDFGDAFTGDEMAEEQESPIFKDAPMMASEKVDTGLDFSMGELNSTKAEPEVAMNAGFSNTMPNLDFPKFETGEEMSFDSDFAEKGDELSVLETQNAVSLDLSDTPTNENFGFDITTISTDEAKPLDLAGISLDLGDAAEVAKESTSELASEEPAEVETKLELVAAYIEMDDKEGAKELLEEIIKEGGSSQRKRAEELLTQIA
ncbi:MAG: FimV/HubP family polar landmark protein [Methylophilaceae bacterium]